MNVPTGNNTTTPNLTKIIDIEHVFRSKNPVLAKLIPKTVYNYLKRIIHEDSINYILNKNQDKYGLSFVDAIISEFGLNIEISGLENLPENGRNIIASNHPLGGPDGLALMSTVGKIWNDIKFPVNDILLFLPNLNPLFIPINKHGSNSSNVRIIDDTFSSDCTIIYFPAGLVSRKHHGIIKDLPWKKTIITKARKHKRDIVPVYIEGKNSNFFYNLANIRKLLRIKANIEMLYLVDEFFKQSNKIINIKFGKPIPYNTFDKRVSDNEWIKLLQEHVYQLNTNLNIEFATSLSK
jgi:putative hemolysin